MHRGPEGLGIRRQRKPQLSGREKSTARALPRGAIREETPLPPEGTRVPIPALLLLRWGASSKPPHLRWPLRPLTSQMGTITVLVKITRNSDWKMLHTGAGPERGTSVTFTRAVPVRPQIPPASLLPEASLHQPTARNPTLPAAGPGWAQKETPSSSKGWAGPALPSAKVGGCLSPAMPHPPCNKVCSLPLSSSEAQASALGWDGPLTRAPKPPGSFPLEQRWAGGCESRWQENPAPLVTACLSQDPPRGQGDATVWSSE